MTKREIITQLREARASHIHWKSYVLLSLRGVVNDHSKTNFPIVQTECDFGKWYYEGTPSLSRFSSFQELEKPHEMIHETYLQMYTLQNASLKGGLFAKKAKMFQLRQREIKELLTKLNEYSDKLLDTLEQLEKEVLLEKGEIVRDDNEIVKTESEEMNGEIPKN